jgi:predicted nuclease with TOPRIM domain
MQKRQGEQPALKYHPETQLLIVMGTSADLHVVENVLAELTPSGYVPANVWDAFNAKVEEVKAEAEGLKEENKQLKAAVAELKARFEDLLRTRESK